MPDIIVCQPSDATTLAPVLTALRQSRSLWPTLARESMDGGDDAPRLADLLPALVASWRVTPVPSSDPITFPGPTPLPWEDITDAAA